jgi:hypothetical protein
MGELGRSGIDWRSGGRNNIKINCPNPHGDKVDTGYNLELTRDGRKAHCWVCNWSGSWNKVARLLGLAEFEQATANTFTERVAKMDLFAQLHDELESFGKEDEGQDLPKEITPWTEPVWRGLQRKFLKKIPSYLWQQPVELKNDSGVVYKRFVVERILWPYMQNDRLVGWVGRRLDKNKKMKYYRAPWCQALTTFFPFDYVRDTFPGTDSVVLVEGEVDALNLLQAGIPALSILGSNNWSDKKRDMLLALGIKYVYLFMDPDHAGRVAAREIKEEILPFFDRVKTLSLDDPDQDPGSLQKEQLEWLHEFLQQA